MFYHPDLHTHDSCLNELENCHFLILIIGGRFGGNYKFDTSKSITNAEYEAAVIKKMPVFTFVKRDVYEDHRVYQKNRDDVELLKKIKFPSIEKQEHAVKIFEFIDKVRVADTNNGYFSFEYANHIKDNLGKQWAGLMYDFLNNRVKYKDQKVVSQTLDNLTLINKKTEELVENLYRQLKPIEAAKDIEEINKILEGSKFYSQVFNLYKMDRFASSIDKISKIVAKDYTWYEYLIETGDFEIKENDMEGDGFENVELWLGRIGYYTYWDAKLKQGKHHSKIQSIINLFENLKKLNQEERKKALENVTRNNG